jgi:electron transfer flavoprotein beta subunit
VLSQFDAIAAEAALRIKEASGGGKVTVISLGTDNAQAAIKQVLAMGADEGLLLNDPAFLDGDSYATAKVLSAAIKKLGDVDAVFCGRQAADWDQGQVGLLIAEELGWPASIIAKTIEYTDGGLKVQRVLADGFETVEIPLPSVVTVSNEFGEPRYPKLPQIMAAAKKTVVQQKAGDLELDAASVGAAGARLKLEKLFIPEKNAQVEFIEGDTPEAQAANLVAQLRAAKLI